MRVRNTINDKTGTVVSVNGAGIARVGVQYDKGHTFGDMVYVLTVFLEVI